MQEDRLGTLPNNLESALTSAALALAEARDGHLRISARRRVWDVMGPYRFDDDQYAFGTGHLRRTTLACFAAEAALGVWERYGGDDEPDRVLGLVEHYLAGQVSAEEVWNAGEALWDRLEQLGEGVEAWVIFAAYHAVNVAFSDELASARMQSDEDQLCEYDAGYYAACAIAGGHPGDPESSIQRRRAFWRWYLESAVPAAFSVIAFDDAAG
jgi:hypothetical protein